MYRKNANGWLKHIDFMILDMICLQLAFMMAYFIKNGNICIYITISCIEIWLS